MAKKYGLILPSKSSQVKKVVARPSIFGDDDDDEASPFMPLTKKGPPKKKDINTVLKRQTQLEIEKALEDDPTAFDYDAVYDSMQAAKAEKVSKLTKKDDNRPKYIQGLLKTAEKRKMENERRTERLVHKERLAEKDEYADKESFVTESYKRKMEQLKADEEEEKRRDALEAKLDVTKQNDLSGFYRSLYKQTTGDDVIVKKEETTGKSEDEKTANEKDSQGLRRSRSRSIERKRSRSRERRSRSRERKRTRSRERKRTRSKERRSRSRERKRTRSKERREPSPSQERREAKRDRDEEGKGQPSGKAEKVPKAEVQSKDDEQKKEERDRTVADPANLVKRTTGQSLSDARARFLARKKTKPPVAIARDDED